MALRPALVLGAAAGALLLGGAAVTRTVPPASRPGPTVVLARAVLDSMNAIFTENNRHWDELADLTTLERMLGTVRPTQREYLGCLQGRREGNVVYVDRWLPARDMKQLQLAVAGNCDGVADLVGTFHTHPFHADVQNRPVKERALSRQDLRTFRRGPDAVVLAVWDVDSVDGAVKRERGGVAHPVAIEVE
ncbi:MAG TPA: hypothetical protein VFS11_03745 [Gemmatimonadales bacterium]|nr:hypothetical protein [Gemmatimonadales bacterium]